MKEVKKLSILLSILIPSIPEKFTYLARMISELERQAQGLPVEILTLIDNKTRTIGAKRNALIEQAQGKYVAFVDDDDRLDLEYVELLVETLLQNPGVDCLTFDVEVNTCGLERKITKFSPNYTNCETDFYYYRKPNHIMCYLKDIALKEKYKDMKFSEDDEWAARASQLIQKEVNIPKVLYYYDYIMKRPKDNPNLLRWENLMMGASIKNSLTPPPNP